jgi:Domain of Unknown Function (DUF928)
LDAVVINRMNLPFKSVKIALAITWTLISILILPVSIEAQTNTPTLKPSNKPNPNSPTKPKLTNQSNNWRRKSPPPPDTKTAGPGRGGCPNMQNKLTSLIPIFREPDTEYLGKYIEHSEGYTTTEHPSFWFYVPYAADNIISSNFVLFNEKGLIEYKTYLPKTGTPGIIKVSLPEKVKLKIGKWYKSKLHLQVYCDKGLPPQEDETAGWVRRDAISTTINPDLPMQQKLAIYVKENMWFDALEILGELKCKDPKNQDWNQSLKSAGLEVIANEQIVNSCTSKNK